MFVSGYRRGINKIDSGGKNIFLFLQQFFLHFKRFLNYVRDKK